MKKLAIFLLTAAAFVMMSHDASAQNKIKIVATLGQITDVAQIIGGDRVDVKGLMGPGVDPHLYKASESDVNKLAGADIIFYEGLFLEAKMESVFKKMKRFKHTVALGEDLKGVKYLDSINYPGHYDPHIWFDVPIWGKVAEKIKDTLSVFDPSHAPEYTERYEAYREKLINLHDYVLKKANELPKDQRVLVTAHDAFRYFGRRYDFEVVGLQGISTESEAGTKDVIQLANFIVERKVKAVFIESSVPIRNIQAVQEAVASRGWTVEVGGELFSDAMGDYGTFEGTYVGMVTHNIDTIVNALGGEM